jgi:hypothetical protein
MRPIRQQAGLAFDADHHVLVIIIIIIIIIFASFLHTILLGR